MPAGVDVTTMHIATRPKAVVLGLMSKMPLAGIVFITMQYLVGLKRLGFDVYYVEEHGKTPWMLMTASSDGGAAVAAAFIAGMMRRFDLEDDHWAFRASARSRPVLRPAGTGADRGAPRRRRDPQSARRHRAAARTLRGRPAGLRRDRSGRSTRSSLDNGDQGIVDYLAAALRVLHLGRELRQSRLRRARRPIGSRSCRRVSRS